MFTELMLCVIIFNMLISFSLLLHWQLGFTQPLSVSFCWYGLIKYASLLTMQKQYLILDDTGCTISKQVSALMSMLSIARKLLKIEKK